MTELNVNDERNNFLNQLRRSVDYAFSNAVTEEIVDDDTRSNLSAAGRIAKEAGVIEKFNSLTKALAQAMGRRILGRGDYFLERPNFVLAPNEVVVENPHDFPALLDLALEKLTHAKFLTEDGAIYIKRYCLEHEFQHGAPALGVEGVMVYYGIKFIKDNTGLVMIQPHIKLTGKIPIDVYESVIGAVADPSPSDIARKIE